MERHASLHDRSLGEVEVDQDTKISGHGSWVMALTLYSIQLTSCKRNATWLPTGIIRLDRLGCNSDGVVLHFQVWV